MRRSVNIYGIDHSVPGRGLPDQNSEPCSTFHPCPKGQPARFSPWTARFPGAVEREADPWSQEEEEEFLGLCSQTGSDLSQVLRRGSSLAKLLNFLNWGPFRDAIKAVASSQW